MNVDEMVKNWDGWAAMDPMWAILTEPDKTDGRWNADEFFATGEQFIAERMKQLKEQGVVTGRGKALDFGCGLGRLTNALGGYFDEVHGVDISAGMVEQATKLCRHPGRVKFFQNARGDLSSFEAGAYDFVFSCIVLQHIPTKYQLNYIGGFMQLLNDGGVTWFQTVRTEGLRAMVPNAVVEVVRKFRSRGRPFIPMYAVTRKQVEVLCAANGCRIVSHDARPAGAQAGRFMADIFVVAKGALRQDAQNK